MTTISDNSRNVFYLGLEECASALATLNKRKCQQVYKSYFFETKIRFATKIFKNPEPLSLWVERSSITAWHPTKKKDGNKLSNLFFGKI